MTDAIAGSLDSIDHQGEGGVIIGAFRCPTTHPRFSDSGPIENDIFVFPRSSVSIRHAGGPSFVADHTAATVYNRGQIYDRAVVAEEGDRSDWFAVPRTVATEAVISNGLEPSAAGPFSFAFAPVAEKTYLNQRRLFLRVQRGTFRGAVDEAVYGLLDDVVASAASCLGKRAGLGRDPRSEQMGEEVRSLISARFEEEWPLSRLEQYLGVSRFSLCRSFRKTTRTTIHRYLLSLRLRASLEGLERAKVEITTLALHLGFSSHSHFSMTFNRTFEETPSACRQTLRL